MDFLYVANAVDLNSGKLLGCRKVGVALSDIDKRISTLNSTKMPITVELEAGYDFTGLKFNARDAEYIIHSVLAHDRVNGEWFNDPYGDLVDRVREAVLRMGAVPLSSNDADIKEMNTKQTAALEKMKLVLEPIKDDLKTLGIDWEYMTWKVGVSTLEGRLHINVNEDSLRLMLDTDKNLQELNQVTDMEWRELEHNNRKSINISKLELLNTISLLCSDIV